MPELKPFKPVDYLVIGHVARDLTPTGVRLGGTAAYASLTAHALGLRVGIVTAAGSDISLEPLDDISLVCIGSKSSSTFENISTEQGRVQYLRAQASPIDFDLVPEIWRNAPIIHLGPIANELVSDFPRVFSTPLLGMTPQGWMREWNSNGLISHAEWTNSETSLSRANAIVISREDVNGNDLLIEQMAQQTKILVVTEGRDGAVLYWNGDRRRFRAPDIHEVDATGAGDIFAAAFFVRLSTTSDPWEAARFATLVASNSVARAGLDGIPTHQEIINSMMVVIE